MREDSCGSTGQGRHRRRLSAEEAPRHAHGKRSAWNENQHPGLTLPFIFTRTRTRFDNFLQKVNVYLSIFFYN
jgi:hypothetical protein